MNLEGGVCHVVSKRVSNICMLLKTRLTVLYPSVCNNDHGGAIEGIRKGYIVGNQSIGYGPGCGHELQHSCVRE